jgi:D-3-phosphoglycerate dehydrogenase
MSEYRLLVSCPLAQGAMEQYEDTLAKHGIDYDVVDVDQQLDENELLDIIDDYHAILAGDDELSGRVLTRADKLEVIAKWGIGTDNIDSETAEELGIAVYNTPGAFSAEVSDIVLGYAIMLTRHLHQIDAAVRNGEWACPRGTSLAGKTFGIIGVGNIGAAVARRAAAHGMGVLGNDAGPLPEDLRKEIDISAANKDELIERADIVSLNCALTPETEGLIGADELDRLGSEGYIINTARGELIEEAALVNALENDAIAGAALDVFQEEPLPADHPLTDYDNVILGSHNAQNTTEAVSRVNDRAIQNVVDGLTNK